jgi:uncharacterized protein
MNPPALTAANGSPESELHAAAWSGDLPLVSSLLEAGADPNWKDSIGETALFGAAAWGHASVVTYLISRGAEVNIQEQSGLTPLHWAASHGNAATVQALITAGAKIDGKKTTWRCAPLTMRESTRTTRTRR